MLAEILTVLVAATLLVLIVAMVRQRHDTAPGRQHHAGSATDHWRGSTPSAPKAPGADAPVPEFVPPPRESAGRQVMAHLRGLEERVAPGLAAQVMPVFLKDTATRIESLREAVKNRDGATAHRLAHTLHGSAATVGAATMVRTCADVIREVRIGAFDGCDRMLDDLDQDFESIRQAAESLRL